MKQPLDHSKGLGKRRSCRAVLDILCDHHWYPYVHQIDHLKFKPKGRGRYFEEGGQSWMVDLQFGFKLLSTEAMEVTLLPHKSNTPVDADQTALVSRFGLERVQREGRTVYRLTFQTEAVSYTHLTLPTTPYV